MFIEKKQQNANNYKIDFLYYRCAREAMYDLVSNLYEIGYTDIYLPGYIGWSPREGSGIFDPLRKIGGLKRHYYKMTRNLEIDTSGFENKKQSNFIFLLVNYFGFRDIHTSEIIESAHQNGGIVIEDNAHGFFTYFCNKRIGSDFSFFSLHKMFPFDEGGGLICNSDRVEVKKLKGTGECLENDPFHYDLYGIAKKRKENYRMLLEIIEKYNEFVEPLRDGRWIDHNVPQTFPVIIKRGNRDKIYEILNASGLGVVSLYHTMIEELRNEEYKDANWLSQRIMNLPVHQDVDTQYYEILVAKLISACKETEQKNVSEERE